MVEDNTNNGEEQSNRRRSRLFVGRRRRSESASAAQSEASETGNEPAAEQLIPTETGEEQAAGGPTDAPVDEAEVHVFDGVAHAEPGLEPDLAAPREGQLPPALSPTAVLFQAPDLPTMEVDTTRRSDRDQDSEPSTHRRRARRRSGEEDLDTDDLPPGTVVKVRTPRERQVEQITEPQKVKGSTRLEAKKQRRRDGREAGRRRQVITEAEFIARREAVDRVMVVRSKDDKTQIGVLEDGVLVEHYVARSQEASLIGNVYLGKVQNVLPSMEAAFVDIGRGRNAVLYSGEVDWDAAQGDKSSGNTPRRIELALKPGDTVLVQVTKDPVGHKGARLTSQVSLPGRYLVYVPNGSMNGISRKLPDTERARLKKILKEVLPDNVGVIVRTAAEGATEEQLTLDVNRLTGQWEHISSQVEKVQAPALLHSEPDLLIKIVRDVFNEDFQRMIIAGEDARETIEAYLRQVAPDLVERVEAYEGERDAFDEYRISEQIEKALDRKVFLPSGGSLVIDRTEAMTVIDVNTGKFVGSGGNLEETVTKNNLEAADEIVRQLRLRDIGGIVVVDFIDMVLETNRDLVLRRLVECLSRDRTKHQVAEVTSLGLVQMTRKKLGLGLLESFSEPCEVCAGRGVIVHHEPVTKHGGGSERRRSKSKGGNGSGGNGNGNGSGGNGNTQAGNGSASNSAASSPAQGTHAITDEAKNALAKIAAGTLKSSAGTSGDHSEETDRAGADPTRDTGAAEATTTAETSGESGTREETAPTDTTADAPTSEPSETPSGRGRSRRGGRGRASRAAQAASGDSDNPANGTADAHTDRSGGSEVQADVESGGGSASSEQPQVAEAPAASAEGTQHETILDIPVVPARNPRRAKREDAEALLENVLDALPEGKPAATGRPKRRRVSTSALTAPIESDS